MNDRPKNIVAIVDRVLSADPAKRTMVVAEACAGDADLRHEVESLLRACDAAGRFLESSPIAIVRESAARPSDDVPIPVPERLAGFRIQRVLGFGGMGIVYLAAQDKPRRTVALKVIKPGLATPSILRRFEHEAEVLGRLHHPGIAQVYGAGTAEGALGPQPFFAMELVDGKPITAFVAERGLKTHERLDLMARVCDAVQHAHQQGIIHRDLKPSNILVDSSGQPKILDFGVARVSRTDGVPDTVNTQAGQIIGTLAYMSPEQAAGDSLAVDTRADVYSLGVIAYELLSGRLPVEIGDQPLHERVRAVHEQTPRPLSSVDTAYRGDIDTVVAKSLQKDKDHRYQSAAEFAADLRRVIAHEPVLARPPSALYQLTKFAQRNRVSVSAAAVLLSLLLLGVFLLVIQNRNLVVAKALATEAASRESTQRRRAESETAKVQEALVTIQSMFHTDQEGGGRDLRVIDMLDQFVARFPTVDSGPSSLTAFRHHVVGSAYRRLGEFEPARIHLEAALALRQQTSPRLSRELLETKFEYAQLIADSGAALVTVKPFADILDAATSALEANDPLVLAIRARLAWTHLVLNDVAAAQAEAEATLSSGGSLALSHPVLLDALGTLGEALVSSGNKDEALATLQRHLGGIDLAGQKDARTLALRCRLSQCLLHLRRHKEAASWLSDVAAMKPEEVPEIGIYATALHLLAKSIEGLGQRDDAMKRFVQAIRLSEKVHGEFNIPTVKISTEFARSSIDDPRVTSEDAERTASFADRILTGATLRRSRFHPEILRLRGTLARALWLSGDIAGAKTQFQSVYFDTLERFGAESFVTTEALMWRALFLVATGSDADKRITLEDLYEYFKRTFGSQYPETLLIQFHLGYSRAMIDVAEAEGAIQNAFTGLMKVVGPDHEWTNHVAEGLASFYEKNGRDAAALGGSPAAGDPKSWRPLLKPADVVSLRLSILQRRASNRAAARNHSAALADLDTAVALLGRDTLLPPQDRDEQLLNVLGARSWSLGELARLQEALADAERALAISQAVAQNWPTLQRRRKQAMCLIDAAVYRARAGRAVSARDALRTAVTEIQLVVSEGLDDEHSWRGILHASASLGLLCADESRRADNSNTDRSVWASEGVDGLSTAEKAFTKLKHLGVADWLDEPYISQARNAAAVCRGVLDELRR
jgi:serine/threonine protein kinase